MCPHPACAHALLGKGQANALAAVLPVSASAAASRSHRTSKRVRFAAAEELFLIPDRTALFKAAGFTIVQIAHRLPQCELWHPPPGKRPRKRARGDDDEEEDETPSKEETARSTSGRQLSVDGIVWFVQGKVEAAVANGKANAEVVREVEFWLSRMTSPDWAWHLMNNDLKLLDAKGREYRNVVGKKVVVTYSHEEQDAEGFFHWPEETFAGRVLSIEAAGRGLYVKFEVGDYDGSCMWVNDEDEWKWA